MSVPRVIASPEEMQQLSLQARSNGTVALVPTMGALHAGHLSLVRAARERCKTVIVSIFVNPTQFAPGEDFNRYPRTFDDDLALLQQADVDYVFAPAAEAMYPRDATTFVDVGELGNRLDGEFRPGHFRGVATIVSKLFHLCQPHVAFFGQKDAAQVAVLRAMVRDLNFPIELIACPTLRETDGLAMSSRNRYLTAEERIRARVLYRALQAASHAASKGVAASIALRGIIREHIASVPGVEIEYAEVVSPESLLPLEHTHTGALLAVAAKFGQTRLIDNLLLPPSTEGGVA